MAETRKDIELAQGTARYWQIELESADSTEKIGEKEVEKLYLVIEMKEIQILLEQVFINNLIFYGLIQKQ